VVITQKTTFRTLVAAPLSLIFIFVSFFFYIFLSFLLPSINYYFSLSGFRLFLSICFLYSSSFITSYPILTFLFLFSLSTFFFESFSLFSYLFASSFQRSFLSVYIYFYPSYIPFSLYVTFRFFFCLFSSVLLHNATNISTWVETTAPCHSKLRLLLIISIHFYGKRQLIFWKGCSYNELWTERLGRVINSSASYSGCQGFKSVPGFLTRFFMVFLSSSR
jgi:hypothetical protein